MRLDQLNGNIHVIETKITAKLQDKPDAETIEVLKGLQQEMHKTMLDADNLMRRLAQILDKY